MPGLAMPLVITCTQPTKKELWKCLVGTTTEPRGMPGTCLASVYAVLYTVMCVLSLCRECAKAALNDVKKFLNDEGGQAAVSSNVNFFHYFLVVGMCV